MVIALLRLSHIAIVVMWIGFLTYWWTAALTAKKNVGVNWRGIAVRAILAAVVVTLFRLHIFRVRHHAVLSHSGTALILPLAGVVLCACGISFAVWARVHIGRNWGMPLSVKVEPELVTSGPYRLVRHPIYGGVLLAMLGSSLVVGPWVFLFALIMAVSTGWYIAAEERQMLTQFPAEYSAYQKRTKYLIPYLL